MISFLHLIINKFIEFDSKSQMLNYPLQYTLVRNLALQQ